VGERALEAVVPQSLVGAVAFIVPELFLVAGACVLLVGGTLYRCRSTWAGLALATVALAFAAWWWGPAAKQGPDAISPLMFTPHSSFITVLALGSAALLVMLSWNHVPDGQASEYHACVLLIAAGVALVGSANDLVLLFLALELISIPTYVLLYLPRNDARSQEATTKYFLLSIFASGFFLFGASYLYGLSGSTNLEVLRVSLPAQVGGGMDLLLGLALVLVLAGLCFRVTAVPFHFYAPDVYQGAPAICAALLAVVPKIAGFTAIYLILSAVLGGSGGESWFPEVRSALAALCWILALASMTIGNLLALQQNDLKRLLAYSSVAHAGYMLVGVGAGLIDPASGGQEAVLFYLVVYAATTLGAFAVVAYLGRLTRPVEAVDDLAGLWQAQPLLALAMTAFLFSLTGLPPTAGFWGKLYIFLSAWSTGGALYRVLAVAMAVNAALGAWYYVRMVAVMYLRPQGREQPRPSDAAGYLGIAACAAVVLVIFAIPGPFWTAAERATAPAVYTPATPTVTLPEPDARTLTHRLPHP